MSATLFAIVLMAVSLVIAVFGIKLILKELNVEIKFSLPNFSIKIPSLPLNVFASKKKQVATQS